MSNNELMNIILEKNNNNLKSNTYTYLGINKSG